VWWGDVWQFVLSPSYVGLTIVLPVYGWLQRLPRLARTHSPSSPATWCSLTRRLYKEHP